MTALRLRARLLAIIALVVVSVWPTRMAAADGPAPVWSALAAKTITASGGAESGGRWDLETGLRLQALEAEWYNTADGEYFDYVRKVVDGVLADPGWNAAGRSPYADALLGQQLMLLYRVTQKRSYYEAARELRERLAPLCGVETDGAAAGQRLQSPRAHGRCVAQAFLAEYAAEFQRPQEFAAVARSYAEETGRQAEARRAGDGADGGPQLAAAWAVVSLVDSLSCYPQASRAKAVAALRGLAAQSLRTEAKQASPAADWLLTYAWLKGVRLHELPATYRAAAMRVWQDRLSAVRVDSGGRLAIGGAAAGQASLGAFLLASTEADLAGGGRAAGRGATVLLDAWYNSQQRKNAAGQSEYFHYKWDDWSDSGYSLFGHMLRGDGLRTQTLFDAPTAGNLRGASYYIIVSPDIPVKNPHPHYMSDSDADVIAAWVRRGGVLILMENDPPNADIEHLNLLADRFGIHFDDVPHHHVVGDRVHGDHVEDGRISVAGGGPLFQRPHTLYMKDTCAISLKGGATALLRDRGDVVMATARYGRGTVFATVDPWLYNEYTDGRKKPADVYKQFDNFAAGKELVRWLIEQRPEASSPARRKAAR